MPRHVFQRSQSVFRAFKAVRRSRSKSNGSSSRGGLRLATRRRFKSVQDLSPCHHASELLSLPSTTSPLLLSKLYLSKHTPNISKTPDSITSVSTGPVPGDADPDIDREADPTADAFDPDMEPLRPNFPDGFPPVPIIFGDKIRVQVFTHRSYSARTARLFEDSPNDPSPDNELLEHLGDAVLGMIVAHLIQEVYPYLRVGPATKIRALLVANINLAEISRIYRFPHYLRLNRSQAINLIQSVHIQADVFEAYVGGVYLDRGMEVTTSWLHALFKPYVDEAYLIVRSQYYGLPPSPVSPPLPPRYLDTANGTGESAQSVGSVQVAPIFPGSQIGGNIKGINSSSADAVELDNVRDTNGDSENNEDADFWEHQQVPSNNGGANQYGGHLALFNQYLQQQHKSVEWVFTKERGESAKMTPCWTTRVKLDGHVLAAGIGNNKQAARNDAAKKGLEKVGYVIE